MRIRGEVSGSPNGNASAAARQPAQVEILGKKGQPDLSALAAREHVLAALAAGVLAPSGERVSRRAAGRDAGGPGKFPAYPVVPGICLQGLAAGTGGDPGGADLGRLARLARHVMGCAAA